MRQFLGVGDIGLLVQLFPLPRREIGDFARIHIVFDSETAADALLGVWWGGIEANGGT